MRVLCINCGSSSLKFDVLDVDGESTAAHRLAHGMVDRVGEEATLSLTSGAEENEERLLIANHAEAMRAALSLLQDGGLLSGIEAIGHRVVHGGPQLSAPVRIDADVVEAIESVSELAPLHNDAALGAIRAARDWLGEAMPMVATFDTGFFSQLPEVARLYAIPRELSEKHAIRRYGFHGLAHRYMVQRFGELRPDVAQPRLITLQLGNGCSATASLDGKPIDTSMGFTPLEGLVMGTRSGDLDPSLPLFLAEKEGWSVEEVGALLNKRSGLLGISGRSHDMRDLLIAAKQRDPPSALAVDAFCYRAKKYVGAYLAALGGADGVIFGGGIGEHSAEVRQGICSGMEWAGLRLDASLNDAESGKDARISDSLSAVDAWVIAVDEAQIIASDVFDCLNVR